MPDSAFIATEEQFRRCVMAAPERTHGELELYTIAEIPRSATIASVIESRYRALDELWARPPDALIVTGTEPTRGELPAEPSWPRLTQLLEWAASSVPTTMLSCLAVHAFALIFDGIERVPRDVKCSGVFNGVVNRRDPLVHGLAKLVPVPHSRLNDIAESDLVQAGYRIVIGDGGSGAGWAVATRNQGKGLFVLCQGHPEYATLTLLREYRRDVRRCLFGESVSPYPQLPQGYLPTEAAMTLERFAEQANRTDLGPDELWQTFPYDEVARCIENTWAGVAARLYRNWLHSTSAAFPLAA